MPILPIRVFPDPILRKRAVPVRRITDDIIKLGYSMVETLDNAPGIGLAAPQVGILKRLVTIHIPEQPAQIIINPIITSKKGKRDIKEGCLSLPGYEGIVKRAVEVNVRYLDQNGDKFVISAEELYAQALEHEIDHLNGILFLDHLRSHEELTKIGVDHTEPHWHDIGYTIYITDNKPTAKDVKYKEILNSVAKLSTVSSESSLSELSYDIEKNEFNAQKESHCN